MAEARVKKCAIISCSRRTDIPAFKMPWVLEQIRAGIVRVANPHNRAQVSIVSLSRNDVRCWVWWSKDYSEWIRAFEDPQTRDLLSQYDAHIFNFTINGKGNGHNPLEPGLRTSLDQRLEQLSWIAAHFGPGSIVLRFDPIVHYRVIRDGEYVESTLYRPDGTRIEELRGAAPRVADADGNTPGNNFIANNLADFARIVSFAVLLRVKYVAVAFAILYPHVSSRLRRYRTLDGSQIELIDVSAECRRAIIEQMRDYANSCAHGDSGVPIQVRLCCVAGLGEIEDVGISACIDSEQIDEQLARASKAPLAKVSAKKDSGQREACHCAKSIDIAGYGANFACAHSCVYCYANPKK